MNEDEDTFQDFVVVVTVNVVPFSNHHRVRSFPGNACVLKVITFVLL